MLGTTILHLSALPVPLLRQVSPGPRLADSFGPPLTCKHHWVFELFATLRVENPSVFDVFIFFFQGVPKELQRSILEGFWGPFESPLGVLFDTLEGLWLFLGIVWIQNGARSVTMRVSKEILARVEMVRGSQRLSMHRFKKDFRHLVRVIGYFCRLFFVRRFCASWLQRRIAIAFRNVLNVVEAAPQARPKTT